MAASLLAEAEIADRLPRLPRWRREGAALARDYRFASFDGAMAFMACAADEARRLDHHPDWSNAFRWVRVTLTTHRAANGAGITALDFELAEAMERIARDLGAECDLRMQ